MRFRYCLLMLSIWLAAVRSFSQITVRPTITHVSCSGSTNGTVELTPTGSGTPYSYTWTPGAATTSSITNKGAGTYSVTVKNTSAGTITATYNIGYKTRWHNFYAGMAASTSGDVLNHTNDGSYGWFKTADGANKIPASTDGWIEYVTTNSDPKIFGLLDALSISGDDGIDFGLGLNSGSIYTENNGNEVYITFYNVGDVLRIERVGNSVNFKKNGLPIWTTTITTAMVQSDLTIRAALYNPNTAIENLGCSVPAPDANAGPAQAITCASSSATLTGSSALSGVTYSWMPGGQTTSSIVVTSPGTYTLKVTDPTFGCVSTATTSVITNTTAPAIIFGIVPTSSLVAYWPFSGNAQDISGNGNHGAVTSASLAPDRFGNPNQAYYFNGATSRIDVPNSPTVDMTNGNDYTMAFWLKTMPGNVDGLPICKTLYTAWNGYMFMVNNTDGGYCNGTGVFTYYVAAAAYEDACADNLISNDNANWYFITGQYKSSTNQTFLYVNGVLQSDVGTTSGALSNSNPLTFGTHNSTTGGFYKGYLDDIRFYKRLLTSTEITALYNEPNPVPALSCANSSVTINGSSTTSGVTYSWSPGGATTSSITVTTAGTYTLKVTNSLTGCAGTSTIAINNFNPVASAGTDQYVVAGTADFLGGAPSASGGSGNYTYSWQPALTYTPSGSVPNPLVNASATVYTLTVTDVVTGCTDSDDIAVHVVSDPYYVVLKKQLDGGHYISYNHKIYFSFEEEYFDQSQGSAGSLSYTIVSDKNAPVSSAPGLIEVIGDNRYTIDLSTVSGMIQGEFYRVAITNKKNEVFYARFKY